MLAILLLIYVILIANVALERDCVAISIFDSCCCLSLAMRQLFGSHPKPYRDQSEEKRQFIWNNQVITYHQHGRLASVSAQLSCLATCGASSLPFQSGEVRCG